MADHDKLIIKNLSPDKVPMTVALNRVSSVISEGRVSNNDTQYAYATVFFDGVVVYTDLNQKSDRFTVTYDQAADRTQEGKDHEGWTRVCLDLAGPKDAVNGLVKAIKQAVETGQPEGATGD